LSRHAGSYLAAPETRLRKAGIETALEVCAGAPAEIIADTAQRLTAAVIVMATHGYSGVKRWALGSVADAVVRATSTPVLLVRGGDGAPAQPAIRRVMVPLDGSERAKQAIPIAVNLAAAARAELLLLHAIAPPAPTFADHEPPAGARAKLHNQAARALQATAGELRPYQLVVTTAVRDGPAVAAIVEEAAQRGVDLIVMATHGYSGLRRWALGSVADRVLHATTTPLLLVRTH
jgi:nucleotide-binding universal stress UspA family protein